MVYIDKIYNEMCNAMTWAKIASDDIKLNLHRAARDHALNLRKMRLSYIQRAYMASVLRRTSYLEGK